MGGSGGEAVAASPPTVGRVGGAVGAAGGVGAEGAVGAEDGFSGVVSSVAISCLSRAVRRSCHRSGRSHP
ncbi:conserved hypothetical protein [Frigoribacterium sp. 9N]|nr:conserved hypothetical protein [Frigoribacterium sp. 9N]